MWMGMKSVMMFEPNDSQEETNRKWSEWIEDNHSAVGDKAVPNVEETRKYLNKYRSDAI